MHILSGHGAIGSVVYCAVFTLMVWKPSRQADASGSVAERVASAFGSSFHVAALREARVLLLPVDVCMGAGML